MTNEKIIHDMFERCLGAAIRHLIFSIPQLSDDELVTTARNIIVGIKCDYRNFTSQTNKDILEAKYEFALELTKRNLR